MLVCFINQKLYLPTPFPDSSSSLPAFPKAFHEVSAQTRGFLFLASVNQYICKFLHSVPRDNWFLKTVPVGRGEVSRGSQNTAAGHSTGTAVDLCEAAGGGCWVGVREAPRQAWPLLSRYQPYLPSSLSRWSLEDHHVLHRTHFVHSQIVTHINMSPKK